MNQHNSAPSADRAEKKFSLRLELVLVVLILIVAACFRLFRIGAIPEGLFRDEAYNGIDALQVLSGHFSVFFEANNGREPLFIYLQALSIFLFGPNAFALRLVSALVGIATVALEYLLVRRMFGRGAALIASLGLAVSYWHISVSRIGFRAILVPVFLILVLYFFWRGLQTQPGFKGERGERESGGLKKHGQRGVILGRREPVPGGCHPEESKDLGEGETDEILRLRAQNDTDKGALYFALVGSFLGLSLYTYLAARFLPFVVIGILAWLAVFNRRIMLALKWKVAILVMASIVVFAPLAFYFLFQNQAFLERPSQLFPSNTDTASLGLPLTIFNGFVRGIGAFFTEGDRVWRHNLSLRPAMDVITAAALLIGMVLALLRFRRPEFAFTLIAFGVMLVPSAIPVDSPHYLRAIGALPPAYALVGIGAVWVFRWGQSLAFSRATYLQPLTLVVIGVLWLGLGPLQTANDYFNVWAKNVNTLDAFEASTTEAARYLNGLPQDSSVLLSASMYPHPDIEFLAKPHSDFRWFDGNGGVPLGRTAQLEPGQTNSLKPELPPKDTYYVLAGLYDRALNALTSIYPDGKMVETTTSEGGYPLLFSYFVPAGTATNRIVPSHPLPLVLDNSVKVLGFDVEGVGVDGKRANTTAAGTLKVALYWLVVNEERKEDMRLFVHLDDASGKTWAQKDIGSYPSYEWITGDLAVSWFDLPVPADAPSGKYSLTTGMYSRSDLKRVQVTNTDGKPVGDTVAVFDVKVTGQKGQVLPANKELNYRFGGQIGLVGVSFGEEKKSALSCLALTPGETMPIRLIWRAETHPSVDYTIFLQLLDPNGRVVSQTDSQPAKGVFPTTYWDKDELVVDDHEMPIPPNLMPGQYRLITGMYLLSTGERLRLSDGGDSVDLGTLTVR